MSTQIFRVKYVCSVIMRMKIKKYESSIHKKIQERPHPHIYKQQTQNKLIFVSKQSHIFLWQLNQLPIILLCLGIKKYDSNIHDNQIAENRLFST